MLQRYHLRWKGLLVSVAAFACCVAVFLVLVVYAGRARAEIDVDLDCYFLVKNCEENTSAAVVGEVYSAGGAGYLYGDAVVIACYYTKADARRVCSLMEQRGEEVGILSRSFQSFTLRGERARLKDELLGGINTAVSVARLLYDTANGLEVGTLPQTAAKANLRGAADALDGLIAANSDPVFREWNRILYPVSRGAREKSRDILFSKDVRYLQVALSYAVLDVADAF